jgi:hypothetical protein
MKFGFKLSEHGLAVSVAGYLLSVVKKGAFHFIILGIFYLFGAKGVPGFILQGFGS